jgi:hypothetical protein
MILRFFGREVGHSGKRMGGLERRDDAFEPGAELERG